MDFTERIKEFYDGKKYSRIKRRVAAGTFVLSHGYIVAYSEKFILLRESQDFVLGDYSVVSVSTIMEMRRNNGDKYYDKIMHSEGWVSSAENKHDIDIKDWKSIFRSIKRAGFNVIVENEDPEYDTFYIGMITNVMDTGVFVRYFDVQGFWDAVPEKLIWSKITKVTFDSTYINVFSKYLRERKVKKAVDKTAIAAATENAENPNTENQQD